VVTDVELVESGGEVCRVAREEISVDAIQDVINLYTVQPMNLIAYDFHSWISRTKNVTFPSLKKNLLCRMKGPSWSALSVPGYTVVDVDVLVPFGSITWKSLCLGCDSAIWRALWSLSEASGSSERLESTELIEGVLERFGEMMWSSPLQETMRVAMR